MRIAIGALAHNILPAADTLPIGNFLGLRSSVTPAVACMDGMAGGYDCVLAYVDMIDGTNSVRTKRFFARAGRDRFEVFAESGFNTVGVNVPTASQPALFFQSGRNEWVLVIRPVRQYQNLESYVSRDGRYWTLDNGNLGYSVVAPRAASIWTGNENHITLAR